VAIFAAKHLSHREILFLQGLIVLPAQIAVRGLRPFTLLAGECDCLAPHWKKAVRGLVLVGVSNGQNPILNHGDDRVVPSLFAPRD